MSRRNKVNKDHYTIAGRLTPDELARERQKQRASQTRGLEPTGATTAQRPKGPARKESPRTALTAKGAGMGGAPKRARTRSPARRVSTGR